MKKFISNEEIMKQFTAQMNTGKPFIAERKPSGSGVGVDIVIAQSSLNVLANDFGRKVQGAIRRMTVFNVTSGNAFNMQVGEIFENRKIVNIQITPKYVDPQTGEVKLNRNCFDKDGNLRTPAPYGKDRFLATADGQPIYVTQRFSNDLSEVDKKLWDKSSTITEEQFNELRKNLKYTIAPQEAKSQATVVEGEKEKLEG